MLCLLSRLSEWRAATQMHVLPGSYGKTRWRRGELSSAYPRSVCGWPIIFPKTAACRIALTRRWRRSGEFSRANMMRLRWPYVRRVFDSALAEKNWPEPDRALFVDAVQKRYKSAFPPVGEETLAGGMSNTIAGRICNHFDLKGSGYTIDGACASVASRDRERVRGARRWRSGCGDGRWRRSGSRSV